jgi:hypothetical protein
MVFNNINVRKEAIKEEKQLEKQIAEIRRELEYFENHSEKNKVRLVDESEKMLEKIQLLNDDIYEIAYWCEKKFPNLDQIQIYKMFGIADDFEDKFNKLKEME